MKTVDPKLLSEFVWFENPAKIVDKHFDFMQQEPWQNYDHFLRMMQAHKFIWYEK